MVWRWLMRSCGMLEVVMIMSSAIEGLLVDEYVVLFL
jgi:hypothetical protein